MMQKPDLAGIELEIIGKSGHETGHAMSVAGVGHLAVEGGHVKSPSAWSRIGGFVALRTASVAALAAMAFAIRLALRP